MKFKDLSGKTIATDISKYKREGDRACASKGERDLGEKLDQLFPGLIYQEFPCFGTRMRIDFYIHLIKTAFEFDGKQHEDFTPHFHGTRRKFMEAKNRDNDKELWCEINNIRLIRISNIDELEELLNERT